MVETASGNGQEHKRWPGWRTAELVRRWAGESASMIADSWDMTRNAVIGKANRLHLPTKKQPAKRKIYERRFVAAPPPPPRIIEPPAILELPFRNLTVYELKNGECHYPEGDGTLVRFCGQLVQDGSSYCPHHHHVVYRPVPKRRDPYNDFMNFRGVR